MDRYRMETKLGEGAFGIAYKVTDKVTGEKRVIKVINMARLPANEKNACRNEGQLLAWLKHRNIVACYDSFEEKGKFHIVMEYCEGGDLEARIRSTVFTEEMIWRYFIQLCQGLEYLHGFRILHRDLKPANIFLTRQGEVKIGDFGISKTLVAPLDMTYTAIGTPWYMSPEAIRGKLYDEKSDIWSLGCILYQMATRTLPFPDADKTALIRNITSTPHHPLPATFSAGLRQLVDMLLVKNPASRPSVAQILKNPSVEAAKRNNAMLLVRHQPAPLNQQTQQMISQWQATCHTQFVNRLG